MECCGCWPDRAKREEYNPLELFVVEEVVEGPEAPLFTKRVRVQIRVVAANKYTDVDLNGLNRTSKCSQQQHPCPPTCKCHSSAGWSPGRWRSTAPAPESWTPPPRPRTGWCSLRWPPAQKPHSDYHLVFYSALRRSDVGKYTLCSAGGRGRRKHWPSWRSALGWTRGPALRWSRSPAWKTRWAWWWGRKESSCNTCHSEGFPRLRCSSPAWRQDAQGISVTWPPFTFDISSDVPRPVVLTVTGWWRWWTEGGREPPGRVAPPPGRTAWTCVYHLLPSCRSSSRSCGAQVKQHFVSGAHLFVCIC